MAFSHFIVITGHRTGILSSLVMTDADPVIRHGTVLIETAGWGAGHDRDELTGKDSSGQYTRFFGGNTETSLVRVRIFTPR
jgi:hypothetical protein